MLELMGLNKMRVRFFIYDGNSEDQDEDEDEAIIEVDEVAFENAEGDIYYKRDKVHETGVSQICLTKFPRG